MLLVCEFIQDPIGNELGSADSMDARLKYVQPQRRTYQHRYLYECGLGNPAGVQIFVSVIFRRPSPEWNPTYSVRVRIVRTRPPGFEPLERQSARKPIVTPRENAAQCIAFAREPFC